MFSVSFHRLQFCLFFYLYSSDPAIKQFLIRLDETNKIGKKFIIHDLDEVHLFVAEDVADMLQKEVDELMDNNSYSEFSQEKESRIRQ